MHVRDALEQLDQIHDHLTRSEVYRGFRVPAVASVGVLGLVAAALQPFVPEVGFVWYWVAVAGVCVLVGTAAALNAYANREDDFARRRTRRVMAQFTPCILAGGAVTVGLARGVPEFIPFLPGLWAVLFGLGIVATRPHLPPAIGLIGLGYVVAGAALVLRADVTANPAPWTVGGVFGVGHLVTAVILWRGAEGETDG